MLQILFFKTLFLFTIIVTIATVPSPATIVDVRRKTRSCYIFKVWGTRGATSLRRHENKVHLLHFFMHLRFLCIFSLGLDLWDLCFAYF
jgi:hypothetical protein